MRPTENAVLGARRPEGKITSLVGLLLLTSTFVGCGGNDATETGWYSAANRLNVSSRPGSPLGAGQFDAPTAEDLPLLTPGVVNASSASDSDDAGQVIDIESEQALPLVNGTVAAGATQPTQSRPTQPTQKSSSLLQPRQPQASEGQSLLQLGALPLAELNRFEQEQKRTSSLTPQRQLRTGVARSLPAPLTLSSASHWRAQADGSQMATIGLDTGNASAVRMGLDVHSLPATARLRIYAPGANQMVELSGRQVLDRVQKARELGAGTHTRLFWTPQVTGSAAVLEVELPAGSKTADVDLRLNSVTHQILSRQAQRDGLRRADPERSGSCQRDFVCEGPQPAVADATVYLEGIFFNQFGLAEPYSCSGTLLADSAATGFPFLLTADHCVPNTLTAINTGAEIYYRATSCGGSEVDERNILLAQGLELLSTDHVITGSDIALLRPLDASALGASHAELTLAGWSAATQRRAQPVMAFHHPGGDHLMRSLGLTRATDPIYGRLFDFRASDYLQAHWSEGTTEPGSSGSGLLNAQGQLIGVLSRGLSSCDTDPQTGQSLQTAPDWYGRFSIAYARGLRPWLNGSARPLSLVVRSGSGPAEIVVSDPAASPMGRRALYAARLNNSATGLAADSAWRVPGYLAELEAQGSQAVAVHDWNGDGRQDVVIRKPSSNGSFALHLLQEREEGGQITAAQHILVDHVAAGVTVLGVGDLDGNGTPDLVLYDPQSKEIALKMLTDDNGSYTLDVTAIQSLYIPYERPQDRVIAYPVAVGDFFGNGQTQILIRDRLDPAAAYFLHWNQDLQDFDVVVSQLKMPGRLLAAVDLNADGLTDLLYLHQGRVYQQLNQPESGFVGAPARVVLSNLPAGFRVEAVNDLDGDGRPDIVLRNPRTNRIRVALNPLPSSTPLAWTTQALRTP